MTPYGDELSFSLPAGPGPGRDPGDVPVLPGGPAARQDERSHRAQRGPGKSGLLAQMALEAASGVSGPAPGERRENPAILQSHGGIPTPAWTSFPPGWKRRRATEYLYLGMKKNGSSGHREPEEIAQGALDASLSPAANMGGAALERALRSLREENGIARTGFDPAGLARPPGPEEQLSRLSAAQLLAVETVLRMAVFLRPGSLAALDTPEAHMGPPLLSAFMEGVQWALDERRAYAVLATQSPVALREIPGRCVHVLSPARIHHQGARPGDRDLRGEHGLIAQHVLGLNASTGRHTERIRELAAERSQEEMYAMFHHGPSSRARALIMQAAPGGEGGNGLKQAPIATEDTTERKSSYPTPTWEGTGTTP